MNEIKYKIAVANQGGAMEAETISKNGQSSKSQTSRVNILKYLAFVALAASIVFSSCKNDNDTDEHSIQLLESISSNGVLNTNYEYDNQHRITKITSFHSDGITVTGTRTFTYSGDNISMSYVSVQYPQDNFTETYTKSDNKIIISISYWGNDVTSTIDIDTDGYPVKYVYDDDYETYTCTYNYQNDNRTKETIVGGVKSEVPSTRITSFVYDDKKSPFYFCKTPKWYLMRFLSSYYYNEIGIINNVKSIQDNKTTLFVLDYYDDSFLKQLKTNGIEEEIKTFSYKIVQ